MAGSGVRFGVYLPQIGLEYPDLLARARHCEAAGVDSLWLFDHLYGPMLPDQPSLEAWTLATALLANTERLRVGHLVLCATFRHPALLAKMATTLDVISGGRLDLGIGSGSYEPEHTEAGIPWGSAARRAEVLEDTLEVLTRMFADERTTYAGHHVTVTDLPNLPRPVQAPRPPLHVGGIGERRTIPLVARFADVWNVPTYGLGQLARKSTALDAACATVGRDPSTIRRSLEAVLVVAPDDRAVDAARERAERRFPGAGWGLHDGGYIGTPARIVDRILEHHDLGFDEFVFFLHDRAAPDTIDLLATDVLPHLP